MTNTIAFTLAFLIIAAVAADYMMNGTENLLFLARKFADFIEWIAFWR